MALSEFLDELLANAPDVRCFAVASEDIAIQNSQQLPSRVVGSDRKKGAKQHLAKWKRRVEDIIRTAKGRPYDDVVKDIESLPLDAVRVAFDPIQADNFIDELTNKIRLRQCGIGIWEQFATDEIVFVWIWQDV